MALQTDFFFHAPVQVVKVTQQNMAEAAEWCGGKVEETESRRKPGQMDSYVWVPTPKQSGISGAFPGMYITKRLVINPQGQIKATYAVFRWDYFERNFFDSPQAAALATWEKLLGKPEAEKRVQPEPTAMAQAMKRAVPKQPTVADINKKDVLTEGQVLEIQKEHTAKMERVNPLHTISGSEINDQNLTGQPLSPSELIGTAPVEPRPVTDYKAIGDARYGLPEEVETTQEENVELNEDLPVVDVEALSQAHQLLDAANIPNDMRASIKEQMNNGEIEPPEALRLAGIEQHQVPTPVVVAEEPIVRDPDVPVPTTVEGEPVVQVIPSPENRSKEGALRLLDTYLQDDKVRREIKQMLGADEVTPQEALEMAGIDVDLLRGANPQ